MMKKKTGLLFETVQATKKVQLHPQIRREKYKTERCMIAVTSRSRSYPRKSKALVSTVWRSFARMPWYIPPTPFRRHTDTYIEWVAMRDGRKSEQGPAKETTTRVSADK